MSIRRRRRPRNPVKGAAAETALRARDLLGSLVNNSGTPTNWFVEALSMAKGSDSRINACGFF